jgi:hypothetical protein
MLEVLLGILLGICLGWILKTVHMIYRLRQLRHLVYELKDVVEMKYATVADLSSEATIKNITLRLKHTMLNDTNYWWLMSETGDEEEFAFQSGDLESAAKLCVERYGNRTHCVWKHEESGESYMFIDGKVEYLG